MAYPQSNLSKMHLGDKFWGCPGCGTILFPMEAVQGSRRPVCPNERCGELMERRQVARDPNPLGNRVDRPIPHLDSDTLIRRAEHEISYSAKRAIEMYIPVWEMEPAWYLFLKCAEAYVLDEGEIRACKRLMKQFGMVEEGA